MVWVALFWHPVNAGNIKTENVKTKGKAQLLQRLHLCMVFMVPVLMFPGFDMEPIVVVDMIIITAT